MRNRRTLIALAALAGIALSSLPLEAKLPWVKKAQAMGFKEIENCASCHTSKMPKKDDHGLNDRGKFLEEQKTKQKAAEVDLAWLKDYKGK